ncbi:hypothetical protein J1N35_034603 [Gossypium stocksii]|uniref:AP2/ERF domain-containing protein n=1 Tax=Gossypium stocksii TaxID=47602 RepID=A0A9D3USB7_9ROSI|nr:hypothetical protein J1N35_034603 [Gossypium stocksii]
MPPCPTPPPHHDRRVSHHNHLDAAAKTIEPGAIFARESRTFDSAEEAARAYDTAAMTLHGPKAKTNFPINPSNTTTFSIDNHH